MEVITKHTMDLSQPHQAPQVFCVQGDTLSRTAELQLLANGRAWLIPEDTTVLISYYKPDGICGSYTTMPDGSAAWEINQNTIRFQLIPPMLTVAGVVSVQLKLMCHEETISTFTFQILVKPSLSPGDSAETYQNWLEAYLPQTIGAEKGQYLRITRVDEEGHVMEVTGMEISMPEDYMGLKVRVNILEEKLRQSENLASRIAMLEDTGVSAANRIQALEVKSEAFSKLDSRILSLEKNTENLDQLGERVSALEAGSSDMEQLAQRVSDLENSAENMQNMAGRIDDLESITDEIPLLSQRLDNLESGSAAYPAIWEESIHACIDSIHQHQELDNMSCGSFALFSDNHNHGGHAGALLATVMEDCSIPYAFFCGDMITEGVLTDAQAVFEEIRQFNAMMAPLSREMDCRALGEKDYCRIDENGKVWPLSDGQIYERYFRNQYLAPQRKPGGKTYYYVEDKIAKIRYIVLNSVYMQQELDSDGSLIIEEGYGFGQEQLDWLVYEALYFEEEGWSVVFIAHNPLTNIGNSNLRDANLVQGILTAFLTGDYYRDVCGGVNSVLIDVDFGDYCPADIVGWFSGHVHQDTIEMLSLSNDYALPVVTIASDGGHSGNHAHAIDFITINTAGRQVDLTRLGYGQSRSFYY